MDIKELWLKARIKGVSFSFKKLLLF